MEQFKHEIAGDKKKSGSQDSFMIQSEADLNEIEYLKYQHKNKEMYQQLQELNQLKK